MASSPSTRFSILSLLPHSLQQGLLSVPSTLGHAPLCPCQPTPDPRSSVLYPPPGPPVPSYRSPQDAPTLSALPRIGSRNRLGLESLEHPNCITAAGIPPHPQHQGHHGPRLPAALGGIPAAVPGWPCSTRMGVRTLRSAVHAGGCCTARAAARTPLQDGSHPDPGRTC